MSYLPLALVSVQTRTVNFPVSPAASARYATPTVAKVTANAKSVAIRGAIRHVGRPLRVNRSSTVRLLCPLPPGAQPPWPEADQEFTAEAESPRM